MLRRFCVAHAPARADRAGRRTVGGARLGFAGAALVLVGCGVLGSDDYSLTDALEGDSGTAAGLAVHVDQIGLPLLPAQPDGHRVDDCEECAATECAEERAACLESERCKAMLWCQGQCSDPNCIVRCQDTYPESPVFEEYSGCVFPQGRLGTTRPCGAACGAGDNVECHGVYEWDRLIIGEETRVEMTARTWVASQPGAVDGFAGAALGSCEYSDTVHLDTPDHGCNGWAEVDAYGTAEVWLGLGFDALALKGEGFERSRIYVRPIPRSTRMSFPLPGFALVRILQEQLGSVPWDTDSGLIFVVQLDCLIIPQHVQFELSVQAESSEITAWVGTAEFFLPSANEDTGYYGGFVNVPPASDVIVSSRLPDAQDGAIWASRRVVVAPGWMTVVNLYP